MGSRPQLFPQAVRLEYFYIFAILQCPVEHGFFVAVQCYGDMVFVAFKDGKILAEPVNDIIHHKRLNAHGDIGALAGKHVDVLCHVAGQVIAVGIFRQGAQRPCRCIIQDINIGYFVHAVMGNIIMAAVIGNEVVSAVVCHQIVGIDNVFVVVSLSGLQLEVYVIGVVDKADLPVLRYGIADAVDVQHGLGIAVVLQGMQVADVLDLAGKIGIAQLFELFNQPVRLCVGQAFVE